MARRLLVASHLLAALCALVRAGVAQPARHPLASLTRQEHFPVIEILYAAGKVDAYTGFTRIAFAGPRQAGGLELDRRHGAATDCRGDVHQGAKVFEALIDLDARPYDLVDAAARDRLPGTRGVHGRPGAGRRWLTARQVARPLPLRAIGGRPAVAPRRPGTLTARAGRAHGGDDHRTDMSSTSRAFGTGFGRGRRRAARRAFPASPTTECASR